MEWMLCCFETCDFMSVVRDFLEPIPGTAAKMLGDLQVSADTFRADQFTLTHTISTVS